MQRKDREIKDIAEIIKIITFAGSRSEMVRMGKKWKRKQETLQ